MTERTNPPSRGAARFWLPFAAVAVVFGALAVLYSSREEVREPAPGAVRRAPGPEDAARHGLEPEATPAK